MLKDPVMTVDKQQDWDDNDQETLLDDLAIVLVIS